MPSSKRRKNTNFEETMKAVSELKIFFKIFTELDPHSSE